MSSIHERIPIGVLLVLCLVVGGCQNVSKLQLSKVGSRAAWQQPEEVVRALEIQAGDTVADLGAGEGYFLPYLSAAVGPEGRVYAVDVDEEITEELERFVAAEGLANVRVVLGEFGDPLLPDGQIDLLFTVNTFHHVEDRPGYFARLRETDLAAGGRVAVLEPNAELGGILSLFLDDGHSSRSQDVVAEMQQAGYTHDVSHDFLAVQIFEVFAPAGPVAAVGDER